jgi:hypothetical protein
MGVIYSLVVQEGVLNNNQIMILKQVPAQVGAYPIWCLIEWVLTQVGTCLSDCLAKCVPNQVGAYPRRCLPEQEPTEVGGYPIGTNPSGWIPNWVPV